MDDVLFERDCDNALRYIRRAQQSLQRIADHLPDKPSRQRTAVRKANEELATAAARIDKIKS